MTVKKTVKVGKKKVMLVVPPKKVKSTTPKRKRAKASMKGWGGVAGTALGSYLGGPGGATIGGTIGRAAGALVSKITGFGDYKVNKNSIVSGNSVPTFKNDADGMVVCHREFLKDIRGQPGFAIDVTPLNPGLARSFPLLSRIAAVFEEYEMVGLVAEYRPSSGSAVSSMSSALGVVILATDYDAANPPFSGKQQMESYEYATSTVPFTGCLHPIECARNRNVLDNLYVRAQSPPSGTDVRLYDMGNFQIATVGMQSDYVVGELWFSYDVRLRKPRLPSSLDDRPPYLRVITQPTNSSNDQLIFGTEVPPVVTSDSNLEVYGFQALNRQFVLTLKKAGVFGIHFRVKCDYALPPNIGFTGAVGSNVSFGPNILEGNTSAAVLAIYNDGAAFRYLELFQVITILADGVGSANQYTFTVNSGVTWSSGDVDLLVFPYGNTVPLTVAAPLKDVPVVFDIGALVDRDRSLLKEQLARSIEPVESVDTMPVGVKTCTLESIIEKFRNLECKVPL